MHNDTRACIMYTKWGGRQKKMEAARERERGEREKGTDLGYRLLAAPVALPNRCYRQWHDTASP